MFVPVMVLMRVVLLVLNERATKLTTFRKRILFRLITLIVAADIIIRFSITIVFNFVRSRDSQSGGMAW